MLYTVAALIRTQRHGCDGGSIGRCVVLFCVNISVPSGEESGLALTNVPRAEDNKFLSIWQLFMEK